MATSNEYSFDLRLKIVQAYENKEGSQAKLARDFRVSKRTVSRLWKLYQQTGSVLPLPHGGGTPARLGDDERYALQKIVEKRPDATLEQLGVLFDDVTTDFPSQRKYEVPTSSSIISRNLTKLKLSRKKKAAPPLNGSAQKSKKRKESTSR
jgi:transposase